MVLRVVGGNRAKSRRKAGSVQPRRCSAKGMISGANPDLTGVFRPDGLFKPARRWHMPKHPVQPAWETVMNKSVIVGAIVVLLAAGGYYQFSYKPAQEAAALAKAAEEEAAAAAKKAEEEAAAAAKAAEEEAAAAAKAAEEEAAAAAAAAPEAAGEAAAAVEEGAADVAEAAGDAAAAAGDAAAAATDAAGDAAAAAGNAAAAALDPANFNADSVIALIDGSALDDATKATLKTAVEAAKANPALVAATLAQVKAALGM